MKLGKDNVVIGNVPIDLEAGDGNVIIGSTDNNGKTVITTPMAVGRGAAAGPTSIAIGAGAKAGLSLTLGEALQELLRLAESAQDQESINLKGVVN